MRHEPLQYGRSLLPRFLLLVVVILIAAPSLPAQSHGAGVDVTVIQIPVVVSRNAKPVENLTREDFEVFINGERQPAAYFDVLEFGSARTPQAGPGAVDLTQRRLTMLVFDIANSTIGQMKRAREHVAAYIDSAGPTDFFAVATYSRGSSVQYVVPFTHDRAAIVRAVATLVPSSADDVLSLAISKE